MAKRKSKIVIYESMNPHEGGHRVEWRWRFLAGNGEVMANSTESYADIRDCEAAVDKLKADFASADVIREVLELTDEAAAGD